MTKEERMTGRTELVRRLRNLLDATERGVLSLDADMELARELQTVEGWWTRRVEDSEQERDGAITGRRGLSVTAD